MTGNEEDADEKQHEPSQKKLEDARKKGDIPLSQDLTTSGAYAGLILAGIVSGQQGLIAFGGWLSQFLSAAGLLSDSLFGGMASASAGQIIAKSTAPILPLFVGPLVGVLLAAIAQRALVLSSSKVSPKLSRISPLANAKQKFGADGLFNFAKSFLKLVIFSGAVAYAIAKGLPTILASPLAQTEHLIVEVFSSGFRFLTLVLVLSTVVGLLDYLWQRSRHLKKNRMTRKEIQDEVKESEGDPFLRQKRREKALEAATGQMMADVPNADVVIVNPTHFAVALRWLRASGQAPICIAKGRDEVAKRIRDLAVESGIPVRSDPPTARALYATLNVGDEVQPEQYRPVAAAIRFAEEVRKHARR